MKKTLILFLAFLLFLTPAAAEEENTEQSGSSAAGRYGAGHRVMHWTVCTTFSTQRLSLIWLSYSSAKEIATPVEPARPVRPMRWT